MSPDRQALLSLYRDDATALLDRALQAQHEPEGLHVAHAALVEALADAHTDGREPGVSTTVPDETIEAAQRALDNCGEESRMVHRDHLANALAEVRRLTDANARLTDLVRHQRGPLHTEGLITDAEYADLAGLTGSPARLEGYDALRGELALQKRAKNVAIGERDEALAALAREEQAHGLTIDQREACHTAADSLAYAIAPVEIIGEHSNLNDPWANAEEALEVERRNHAAALATARLDGARVMHKAASRITDEGERREIEQALRAGTEPPVTLLSQVSARVRALDPAAVVGSGS